MHLPKNLFVGLGCILIFAASPLLRAMDGTTSFVLNLPLDTHQAMPIWLGEPILPQTSFATLNLPILAPDSTASLLVTVFFKEKEGGFLRIAWQGTQGTQMLSSNFYEGIGMSNQRSLLITPAMTQGDGTLSFQCGSADLGIDRIKLEWLEKKDALISPQVQDLLVTSAAGKTAPAAALDGQTKPVDPAAWHDKIVNIPISDSPQRIEQGVEYSVTLDSLPRTARFSLKEAGLPWGKHLVVWINQQRAGTITPSVPDLSDEGFLNSSPQVYVGWRDGFFYAPLALLKVGDNTVQFSAEDELPSTDGSAATTAADPVAPLAAKDILLQLDYPVPPSSDVSAPTQTDASTPTGETAPTTSIPSEPLPTTETTP